MTIDLSRERRERAKLEYLAAAEVANSAARYIAADDAAGKQISEFKRLAWRNAEAAERKALLKWHHMPDSFTVDPDDAA